MTNLDTALARFSPVQAEPAGDAEHLARIATLQARMLADAIAAVWLDASSSLTYYTGLTLGLSERIHGALIPAQGPLTYVTPAFEEPKLRAFMRLPGEVTVWEEDEDPFALIADRVPGPIAIDPATPYRFTAGLMAAGARVVPAEPLIATQRRVKSPAE
ncbi:MAG: aminopeptidase P family N-terminal domain-containing protein, partial [Gemmobacter sp.]|nr:aminopeptidase P family N-terminal domain-containing protein [Gemmobacter sp.]